MTAADPAVNALDASRRIGWARAYAAEAKLAERPRPLPEWHQQGFDMGDLPNRTIVKPAHQSTQTSGLWLTCYDNCLETTSVMLSNDQALILADQLRACVEYNLYLKQTAPKESAPDVQITHEENA